jgi:hypothetical protein
MPVAVLSVSVAPHAPVVPKRMVRDPVCAMLSRRVSVSVATLAASSTNLKRPNL